MNKPTKKQQKAIQRANTLEQLKEIGTSTANQMRQEASSIAQDFTEQLFGLTTGNISGEILPGDTLEFTEVTEAEHQEMIDLQQRVQMERRFLEEERVQVEKKSNELRIQLKLVQEEIITLAEKTDGLAESTQIAAMQAPVEPGVYHVIFFEKLLEFLHSFTKKVEEASVWLNSANKRAAKKNVWGANYKKYGAKYLLSGEHYASRSAG